MRSLLYLNVIVVSLGMVSCRKQLEPAHTVTLLSLPTEMHNIDIYRDDTLIVVGGDRYDYGSIYISYNKGTTWSYFDSISEKALYSCRWVSPANVIAAGYDGKYFQSLDGGNTWEFTQLYFWSPVRDIELVNDNLFLAGGNGLKSGFIASDSVPGTPGDLQLDSFINEIRDITDVNGALYAAGYGLILKSTDNGGTWHPTSAADDFFIGLRQVNSSLYAAGANGTVLQTNDGGIKWKQLKKGNSVIPSAFINAFDANSDGLIIAGERGMLLWYSFAEEKWLRIKHIHDDITAVKINAELVYLTTRSGKVLAITL